ncbi:MAG TPA: YbjN domain-containing protein [Longimicrobiales bacterium]|nr:YbjN domain-containing protein [Longimicrobiales bacterium]
MMTREDFESYMLRLGVEYEEVDDGMWVINAGETGTQIVVSHAPPLALLRLKVMTLPEGSDERCTSLYRRLLELNATDIVHGAYGIEGNEVVLSDALDLEDLDFGELRNSYESLALAASSHTPKLMELVAVAQGG